MRQGDHETGQRASLPTDGLQVEEIRDADTVRLFVREWRWRSRVHYGDRSLATRRGTRSNGPAPR